MDLLILIFIFVLAIVGITYSYKTANSKPSTCPNCNKQYSKAEEWSYTEYSWGLRCPHCKHEFDITP